VTSRQGGQRMAHLACASRACLPSQTDAFRSRYATSEQRGAPCAALPRASNNGSVETADRTVKTGGRMKQGRCGRFVDRAITLRLIRALAAPARARHENASRLPARSGASGPLIDIRRRPPPRSIDPKGPHLQTCDAFPLCSRGVAVGSAPAVGSSRTHASGAERPEQFPGPRPLTLNPCHAWRRR
jgi:hypothetical protein